MKKSNEAGAFFIRKALKKDTNALEILENSIFHGDRLPRRQIAYHIANRSALMLVACDGPELAGYGLLFLPMGKCARIYSIAVDPAYQGQGIGGLLFDKMIDAVGLSGVSRVRLEVRKDNIAALEFYKRRGFRVIRQLDRYYEDGADGYRMEKTL